MKPTNLPEWFARVGSRASVTFAPGLRVAVVIEEARQSYGALQVKVSPVEGSGSAWVDASRVVLP